MSSNRRNLLQPRREFLKQAAAAGVVAGAGLSRAWSASPNERIGVACVGLGGMGSGHLRWLSAQPWARVAGLADVDAGHLEGGRLIAPDAAAEKDFREIVGRDDVDVVFVATPDHWHALATVAAAEHGKHIYCEKPLANSVGEGRAIVDAVNKAGVVLQTGSHERSNPGASVAKRLYEEGRLGEVREVEIHLPNSDDHLQQVENFTSPPPDTDPPSELDWDFWLGHTPKAAYNEKRCHFWWRFHSNYGGGEITDRGAHVIDLAHMILGLDDSGPIRVSASGSPPKGDFFDAFITFDFEMEYPGGLRMVGGNTGPRGLKLKGTDGELFIAVHGCELTATPQSILDGVELPQVDAYDVHRNDFFQAVRTGGRPVAHAEAGHRTATACHLNNVAMRVGRAFDWDPSTERSGDPEVNDRLMPTMREPWTL
ncbi:Gfo/Idh/MocA family oxidoreductase [Botrimarina sp.]|uniref:Gfo/Idh/MocA family protein n=1 Tax=Botrimarina sp. TaxID=2795802 RepID=UPI0032EBC140